MASSISGWEGTETGSGTDETTPSSRFPTDPIALAIWPIPSVLWNTACNQFLGRVLHHHPGLFERLSAAGKPVFLIDPTDLPLSFLLDTDPLAPSLRVLKANDQAISDAVIRGKLSVLLALMQGSTDGDALFFSRSLEIEGDTEAVLALRNAIDDAEIDLIELLTSVAGPFQVPAAAAARGGIGLLKRAHQDLSAIRTRFFGPLYSELEEHQRRLDRLEQNQEQAAPAPMKKKPNRSRSRS